MLKKLGNSVFGKSPKKTAPEPEPDIQSSPDQSPVNPIDADRSSAQLQENMSVRSKSSPAQPAQDPETGDIQILPADIESGSNGEDKKAGPKKGKLSQLQDYTKKGVNKIQGSIKEKKEKLQNKSKQQLQKGKEKILQSKEHFLELTGEIRKNMDTIKKDIKASVNAHVKEFMFNQKEKLNKWLRLQVEKSVVKALSKAPPKIKKSLKSPGMWKPVEKLVDDIVDEIWPEVEEEVLYQLRVKMNKPFTIVPVKQNAFCLLKPWYWVRAWYLYHTDPVDKNFWQLSRTFSYWIIVLIKLIPWWGVQNFFFTLVFLMIDKRDEYQLVSYILEFKKYQFVTGGIINGVIGYILYFICANIGKFDSTEDFADCMTDGPGVQINIAVDVTSFLLQIGLVWLCFFLLPFSEPKGRPKFKYVQTIQDKPEKVTKFLCCFLNGKRGGRLKKFIIYDMITGILSIGLYFIITYALNSEELWQKKGTIYFCKLVYGMLSFPFLIFAIPVLPSLLTKSRPTAYDRDGNCVPTIGAIETEEKKDEEEGEDLLLSGEKTFEELVDDQSQQTDQDQP